MFLGEDVVCPSHLTDEEPPGGDVFIGDEGKQSGPPPSQWVQWTSTLDL